VAPFGYFSDKSMTAYESGGQYSMYILFNTPISYLEAYIYEVGSGSGTPIEIVEETVEMPVIGEEPFFPPDEVVTTIYFDFLTSWDEQACESSFSHANKWAHFTYHDHYTPIKNLHFWSSNPFYLDELLTEPLTTVPEPSTLILLSTGIVSLAGLRKKFRIK
ncbi:MAG: PEP-CTERM sorting domain-containing protein, partial [Proteobacteria bacterium]|nr:PEP-CTERM sorting domain-containing protein [Pseudomonadota bacterium]